MIEGGNDEHGTDERDDSQSKMETRSSRLFLLLDGSPGPDASCPEHENPTVEIEMARISCGKCGSTFYDSNTNASRDMSHGVSGKGPKSQVISGRIRHA